MRWLGVDVGGANIKLSNGNDFALSIPFALWKQRERLPEVIHDSFSRVPKFDGVAATMTGELADCFETKAEGVRYITQSFEQATTPRNLAIYGVDGLFRTAAEVCETPSLAAASNWHALARFAARLLPERTGLVIDVGSTTTDIVPVIAGQVASGSRTDTERLLAGELIYTGVGRTPICAVTDRLPYRGQECPVAAEFFATTSDIYFLLGEVQEVKTETADGREMTRQFAIDRLARQICADRETFTFDDAVVACQYVRDKQVVQLSAALDLVLVSQRGESFACVISGSGEFLARELILLNKAIRQCLSLTELMGEAISSCAPAAAVAAIAAEDLSL